MDDNVFQEDLQTTGSEGLTAVFTSALSPTPENMKEVEEFVGGIVDVIKKVEQHGNQLQLLSGIQEQQQKLTSEIGKIKFTTEEIKQNVQFVKKKVIELEKTVQEEIEKRNERNK